MKEIRVKANILAAHLMLNGTEVYYMFYVLNLIYHVLNGYSYYFMHILFVVFCTRLHVFNFPSYASISKWNILLRFNVLWMKVCNLSNTLFLFLIIQEVAFPKNWGQVWRSLRIKTRLLCLPKPLQSKYEYPWAKNKLKFNSTWWPDMWLLVK